MSSLALLTSTPAKLIGAAMLAILVSGCAQQQTAGYYTVPHDTTETDALNHAQGGQGARAPSQIQLGFGNTAQKQPATPAEVAHTNAIVQARPLTEAKTFLGTVPCLAQDAACQASRLTLTLAPDHQWRARTVLLGTSGADRTIVQQGCWNVVGTQPLRIVLQMAGDATKANLSFINDNVLRVNLLNEIAPTLDYHLTRQADIDPIDDVSGLHNLDCKRPTQD
ncbi:MAG: copper resistance protein NlpE N-terminal domain-containing protein [Burkholderiaceae bacterium]|nr:copper resistance protein NlpE N-terminal domain-containing protein [Burkholderiaceae bacterium]